MDVTKTLLNEFNKVKLFFDNKPVNYSTFKNLAMVSTYGKKPNKRIVFLGVPKVKLIGFYVSSKNDTDALREAYSMILNVINGDVSDYVNAKIQIGNCGIPIRYGNLTKK